MPLASGADVKIGAYEFMLSTDDDAYEHYYENLYGDGGEIEGTEGKKQANKNILFWGYDDFRKGEGLRYYDKEQSGRWWEGNNNPRGFPGAITSPPTRTTSSTITVGSSADDGCITAVDTRAWYFRLDQGFYSTDASTWTENTDVATELPASYTIKATCHDGEYVYIAADDNAGNRGIWRVTSTTVVDDFVTAHAATGGSSAQYSSIAVRDGFLYAWTGGWLFKYNTQATLPITHSDTKHAVFKPGPETGGASLGKRVVAGEDAVYAMKGGTSSTVIYEYKLDPQTNKSAGRTMWNMPSGFNGLGMCVQAGVLCVAGLYEDKFALWGYSTVSRQPFFLGYFGEAIGTGSVKFCDASHGAQILIGTIISGGGGTVIWVYDLEEDSFSQLDEGDTATLGTPNGSVVLGSKRLVASKFTTTTAKVFSWATDSATPAGSWDWVSSAFDFGYPQDEKVLLGFHVVNDPGIAAGTVDLDYQLDEDGSWVDSGTDTAAASKHTYMQISDGSATKKFRTLRFRMNGSSGARVFSAYARAYINSKQEVWRLKLDLNNEPGTNRHPSNRQLSAVKLRNNLHTLVSDGNVVTFLDGRRRLRKSSTSGTGYTSHTVLVEFPKDAMDSAREGTVEVILRSVAPSA